MACDLSLNGGVESSAHVVHPKGKGKGEKVYECIIEHSRELSRERQGRELRILRILEGERLNANKAKGLLRTR